MEAKQFAKLLNDSSVAQSFDVDPRHGTLTDQRVGRFWIRYIFLRDAIWSVGNYVNLRLGLRRIGDDFPGRRAGLGAADNFRRVTTAMLATHVGRRFRCEDSLSQRTCVEANGRKTMPQLDAAAALWLTE
jgi:hypothetical protein